MRHQSGYNGNVYVQANSSLQWHVATLCGVMMSEARLCNDHDNNL